jgi:hypothetical protein
MAYTVFLFLRHAVELAATDTTVDAFHEILLLAVEYVRARKKNNLFLRSFELQKIE